jgi:hypothetical protein
MKTDDRGDYKWSPILDEMDEKGMSVMKFRSSRGKPRIELTEYAIMLCCFLLSRKRFSSHPISNLF